MKKTVRIWALALAVCAVCAACFAAGGCGGKGEKLSGSMKIVVYADADNLKEYTVDLTKFESGDKAVKTLDYLADNTDFFYEGSRGINGIFLTAAGYTVPYEYEYGGEKQTGYNKTYLLKEDTAAMKYVYIYTNVEADKADYAGMSVKDYGGETLAESNKGISGMNIGNGAVILISTFVYSF